MILKIIGFVVTMVGVFAIAAIPFVAQFIVGAICIIIGLILFLKAK